MISLCSDVRPVGILKHLHCDDVDSRGHCPVNCRANSGANFRWTRTDTVITDVQHLPGHASVKTTEKAYTAFVKNERFKQTIDLLDTPVVPKLKVVK